MDGVCIGLTSSDRVTFDCSLRVDARCANLERGHHRAVGSCRSTTPPPATVVRRDLRVGVRRRFQSDSWWARRYLS